MNKIDIKKNMEINNPMNVVDLSNEKIFKVEYEQYFSALKYFAMHYLEDEELVRDLLQDFFINLWEKGDVFKNEHAFKVYLYRGIRNNCLTFIRDNKRRKKHWENYDIEEFEEDFVNKIIESEVFAEINNIFNNLPEVCKKVYCLSLDGKTHQEIADELHITINTIKRHKNHANHYLRDRLGESLILLISLILKDIAINSDTNNK